MNEYTLMRLEQLMKTHDAIEAIVVITPKAMEDNCLQCTQVKTKIELIDDDVITTSEGIFSFLEIEQVVIHTKYANETEKKQIEFIEMEYGASTYDEALAINKLRYSYSVNNGVENGGLIEDLFFISPN